MNTLQERLRNLWLDAGRQTREEAADRIDALEAENAALRKERDDYKQRFESLHMRSMDQISGGRHPDGTPAW